ncbi:unnamed protein product [Heligmosomoides polygyrus]|uniref:EGF-like domain-containing protein n=1 Tax=Heligmosomoides polygyrus TaxID=6339 RepID=A0A183F4G4_HELPZ|nr:unnamed protein product [Heligmosomoides polygyrus]
MLDQGRCFCAPGYYSKYCENRGFRPAVESDVSLQSRSLVLIFSLSTSMEQQFLDFRANLPGMVAGMGGVLDDISSYVFVGYVSTSANVNTYYVTGGSQLSDLDQMFDSLVFYTPSASQPFLGVLLMALQTYSNTKAFSNVLLFADTGASDAGDPTDFMSRNTYEHTLISTTSIWRYKLTFIISNPQQQRILTNSFDVYRRLALATHGDLLLINKNDTAKVMTEVLSNYDKTENLAVRYRFNCSDFPMLIIPTENFAAGATKVLLTVDSNDATKSAFLPPSLGDLNGVAFEATSEGAFYSFYTMPAGTAYVRVDSQNTNLVCSMRVFVTSGSTLLLSYIDNPSMDIGYPFPYNGVPQTASGLPIGVSKTALVALQSVDSTAGSALQGVSIGSKRALDSTYTLTFAVSQDCTPGPFSQSAEFYDGDKRATRVLPAYCSSLGSQCPVTNVDVLADPRQSRFRQIIFAVENSEALSAVAQNLLASVTAAIALLEADGDGGWNNQYALILYDDKEVRAVSSTPIADDFSQQFTASMNALAKNEAKITTSLSLDAIHKWCLRDGRQKMLYRPALLLQSLRSFRELALDVIFHSADLPLQSLFAMSLGLQAMLA